MNLKTKPIITHTEILSRAIGSVLAEIEDWHRRFEALPVDRAEVFIDTATKELREKLEALKTLYRIETGTEWE